jgi:hypothetical protein
MLSRFRSHRPSHATVVAYLALFVALGGSSYAALKVTGRNVPKDALTGADIKNLTGKDVRNNSLTGADVKNLGSADVANGKLLAEDFASGQLPTGPQGPAGTPATKLFAYVAFNSPSAYTLGYGSGVVGVSRGGVGTVDVRFDRSVHGCATHVTPGVPPPHTDDLYSFAHVSVLLDPDEAPGSKDDVIRVLLNRADGAVDTSFLITLFC